MSLKKASYENRPKNHEKESVKFLKGAVILLVEASQQSAAKLLINHFLKKDEKPEFGKLLPESVNNSLARRGNS
jgi:hypothetical protein